MKTIILRKAFVGVFVLLGLAMLLAAGTRGDRGLVGVGDALPANITIVTNTNDSGPGSLRNALAIANDGDTIDATGVSGTISLTSGELQITHNVTINGPGGRTLLVNGNAAFRVFENFASNVAISGLTITNGLPTLDQNGGGGILNHGGLTLSGSSIVHNSAGGTRESPAGGGGISSSGGGMLTVTNSVISGNGAGDGGGIAFTGGGTLTVTNSAIDSNSAIGSVFGGNEGGGGILIGGGTLTVTNSVISGNLASRGLNGASGGGILAYGTTVTVSNSTIEGNSGGCGGGGICATNNAQLTVMASTISGNSAVPDGDDVFRCPTPLGGGGIKSLGGGTLTVMNSTISSNNVGASGAGGGVLIGQNNVLTIKNSTFSGNSAPPGQGGAIFNMGEATIGDTVLNAGATGGTILSNGGTVTSLGYNLASDNGGGVLTGPGDQINTDPMLGPLQDNGGRTFTHALLPGSPAIDAGDPNFTAPPFFDQRGPDFWRLRDGRIDIGSFEVQSGTTPSPTPTPTASPTLTPTPTPTATATPRPTPTPRPSPTPRPRPTPTPRPAPAPRV